jgi:hypothetical protein
MLKRNKLIIAMLTVSNCITLIAIVFIIYKFRETPRDFEISSVGYMKAELENGNIYSRLLEGALIDNKEEDYNRLATLIMNGYGSEFALFHSLSFFNETGNLTALSDVANIYTVQYSKNKNDPSFYFTLFFLAKAYENGVNTEYNKKNILRLIDPTQQIQHSSFYLDRYNTMIDSLLESKQIKAKSSAIAKQ